MNTNKDKKLFKLYIYKQILHDILGYNSQECNLSINIRSRKLFPYSYFIKDY